MTLVQEMTTMRVDLSFGCSTKRALSATATACYPFRIKPPAALLAWDFAYTTSKPYSQGYIIKHSVSSFCLLLLFSSLEAS